MEACGTGTGTGTGFGGGWDTARISISLVYRATSALLSVPATLLRQDITKDAELARAETSSAQLNDNRLLTGRRRA